MLTVDDQPVFLRAGARADRGDARLRAGRPGERRAPRRWSSPPSSSPTSCSSTSGCPAWTASRRRSACWPRRDAVVVLISLETTSRARDPRCAPASPLTCASRSSRPAPSARSGPRTARTRSARRRGNAPAHERADPGRGGERTTRRRPREAIAHVRDPGALVASPRAPGAVVTHAEAQLAPARRRGATTTRRRPVACLSDVLQRLEDAEVDGALDLGAGSGRRRSARARPATSERIGDRAQRLAEAAVGEQRRVDAVRERAQLLERLVDARPRARAGARRRARDRAGRGPRRARARCGARRAAAGRRRAGRARSGAARARRSAAMRARERRSSRSAASASAVRRWLSSTTAAIATPASSELRARVEARVVDDRRDHLAAAGHLADGSAG